MHLPITLIYRIIRFVFSRLVFWNWYEVQFFGDQASIQPHGHRSPDVERIFLGNSGKSRLEYRLMALMILENKHVTLGDRHFNRGFTSYWRHLFIHRLHQYSIRCLLHHHRCSVPSCSECCGWLVLRCMSTPQTARYRQKFDGGFEECFRIRRKSCGFNRTGSLKLRLFYFHGWFQPWSSLPRFKRLSGMTARLRQMTSQVERDRVSALELEIGALFISICVVLLED